MVYTSFEDMITVVAGPRVGKSTSLVIPAIIAAPGAVVTTSNKRDVLDATRDVRKKDGPVWVFDPQRVAREDATWWWNPLSYVTDDTRAAKLAQYFASGSRATDAKTDAFFDGAGQNLLAGMLLAAAVGGRPIAQVFSWLTDSTDEEPVRLLRDGGYPMIGDAVLGIIQSTDKLRGSVYSTGQEMAACLKNTQVADWVNPRGAADPRPQFDAAEFVRGRGTLYSLSKEGAGTAGPLVTALTAATLEAATDLADTSPGGRLRTPLAGILDEAANVCRWRDLPDLYSHFGSRGIPIMSVFQSWSQGVAVFGPEGMLKHRYRPVESRMVEHRRGRAAPRNALARMGGRTSRPRPRRKRLVDQPRRPAHGSPARRRRPLRGLEGRKPGRGSAAVPTAARAPVPTR